MGGHRAIQFCHGPALSLFTGQRNLAHPAGPSHHRSHESSFRKGQAKRHGANNAAMVVQSFCPKHTGFSD
jgi:hypothetical protein